MYTTLEFEVFIYKKCVKKTGCVENEKKNQKHDENVGIHSPALLWSAAPSTEPLHLGGAKPLPLVQPSTKCSTIVVCRCRPTVRRMEVQLFQSSLLVT